MNIILLSPKLNTWSPNVYAPLGLAYIGAVLEQSGHSVQIIDLNVQHTSDRQLSALLEYADLIGITGMITEYNEVCRLSNLAGKANRRAPIVIGGPITSCAPHKLMTDSNANILVLGEGESTISKFISAIQFKTDISMLNGIAYRVDYKTFTNKSVSPILDMDSLPLPARHLLDMKQYTHDYFKTFGIQLDNPMRCATMITSRGCPYQCTYCFKGAWGNQWRGRSPNNIINEMLNLHDKHGVNGFIFVDDTFVLDRKRVDQFCDEIISHKLEFNWYCNGRVNLMNPHLLNTMAEAGCKGIAYGIESGNQEVLDKIKKGTTLKQIKNAVQWTKDSGIHATGYFMLGSLGETRDTIRDTIDFARGLDLDFYGFSITTPFIGTEMYDLALKAGLIHGDSVGEWHSHVNTNLTLDCSDRELQSFASSTFKEFYLEKTYGKHYLLNPQIWYRTLLSIRNMQQAKALLKRVGGIK